MTPQFNLLRPQEYVGGIGEPTFHRYERGNAAYISFVLPRPGPYVVLWIRKGNDWYRLEKRVIVEYCKEN